ncbi:MAG: GSU2403 family nucleotidyltransferase fold protein [Burkholderiales bacterium]
MAFNTEQRRQLQNLLQFYETWKEVSRNLAQLRGGMYWRVINSKEYLYKYVTSSGIKQSTSIGPKTPETEVIAEDFQQAKKDLQERLEAIKGRINTLAPITRVLNLPAIDETAGKILRALDQVDRVGKNILVIGTCAMTAYEMTAETRFAEGFDATEDLDLTIVVDPDNPSDSDLPRRLLLTLKEVDKSFVVSHSSSKTVVNKRGYRVDLLMSNELAPAMQRSMPWKPEALEGQEWLALGTPVRQILVDLNGWPVLVTAPDPRYFALHKLWLSKRPKRIREGKAPKDAAQGKMLLKAIQEFMPHYPIDDEFIQLLPSALRQILDAFQADTAKEARRFLSGESRD